MQDNIEQKIQQVTDLATSAPATAGSVGTGVAVVLASLPTTIQILTVLVLVCQLVAWGYKGWRWFRTTGTYKKFKEQ